MRPPAISLITPQGVTAREQLHRPTPNDVQRSQLTEFMSHCERATGARFATQAEFYAFTVNDYRRFWSLFLEWSGTLYEGATEPVCTDDVCERAVFFPELRLGYVENLLRLDGELHADRPAITARDGAGRCVRLTRGQLASEVFRAAAGLEALGVRAGDRVVAIAHNDERAIIAGLAAAALGATLSTTAPEVGSFSILARFSQLQPTVLLCHAQGLGESVAAVATALPSLKAVVTLDDAPAPGLNVPVHTLSALKEHAAITPRRFPFNQPLFTLFSSGTTGKPKCIVHGAGGTLLEHLKEHRLHGDLRAGDKLFFQTSCSWMMWNWQLSALAAGAEIVLYSGPVKEPATLWSLVAEEQVTVFGTSPAYLRMCEEAGYAPRGLEKLRVLMSTGSILFDHQFDWVRKNVGPVPVQSISGGTDIIGCFVLGNPNLPVYRGESQCRSFGLDVQAHAPSAGIGELVCRNPFPSRPLGFFGDLDGKRFHAAYFAQHEGVWTHGDLIELTAEGSARMHGRSDGILNVNGIRIGPAEIYRILQGVPEVVEALAVEQQLENQPGQSRLVLLVMLTPAATLDGPLKRRIRQELAARGSAAHVPELILHVSDLPTTHSGKRSEAAARDVLNGRAAANAGALRNPESLAELQRQLAAEQAPREEPGPERSLEATLLAAFERVLDVAPVSRGDNFFELGGTSLLAVRLFNELSRQTGRQLPPSFLYDAPTVARMVEVLEGSAGALSGVITLRRGGAENPLFVVPGLAGDVLELKALAEHLPPRLPVYGFRARGLAAGEEPHSRIEPMARDYVEQLLAAKPRGPYALLGYSLGGLIACEMARMLRAAGHEVAFVGLLDSVLDEGCLPLRQQLEFRALRAVHRQTGQLEALLRPVRRSIERRLGATRHQPVVAPWLAHELSPAMQRIEAAAWQAFRVYRPAPLHTHVTYFRAAERSVDHPDPLELWREATGGRLTVVDVPGDHFSMLREPCARELASRVTEQLEAAALL